MDKLLIGLVLLELQVRETVLIVEDNGLNIRQVVEQNVQRNCEFEHLE